MLMVLLGCGLVSGLDEYAIGEGAGQGGGTGGASDERKLPHDDALIARYWIDDATQPLDGGTLRGSGPLDLDLSLSDGDGNLAWAQQGGGIGLRWDAELDGGGACAPLPPDAFARIDGLQTFTIELVVSEMLGSQPNQRLLFHAGTDDAWGLTLASATTAPYVLYVNNLEYAHSSLFFMGPRQVVHVTADLGSDAVAFIVNGMAVGMLPQTNTASDIVLFVDAALCLGNREADDRSPMAVLSYAALYDRALSLLEAQAHAEALLDDDDGLLE